MALPSMDPSTTVISQYWRVSGRDCRGPVLCRVTRRLYSGQTCGKILPVYDHHDGREDRFGSLLSSILFRLVAPPLQLGVVGPYRIRGTWFPSCLPLVGTGRIQILGP
jgi:hypothetical protein